MGRSTLGFISLSYPSDREYQVTHHKTPVLSPSLFLEKYLINQYNKIYQQSFFPNILTA